MGEIFEDQKPNWPPGTGSGYHAITFGWLVDQLVRRTDPDGRSLGTYLREEITEKHGIDFTIGLPREKFYRVARQDPPGLMDYFSKLHRPSTFFVLYALLSSENSFLKKLTKNPSWYIGPEAGLASNDPEILSLEIGSANGVGTARGLAALFDLLIREKLVKAEILDRISKPIRSGSDLVLGVPIVWGHGFMHFVGPTGSKQLGHPGYGGQNLKFDMEHGLSFAYITNGLSPDMGDDARNFLTLQHALYDSL